MANTNATAAAQQANNAEQNTQSAAQTADIRKFDVTVKRVQMIVNPETGYTSVDITIDKPIPGFVKNDAGAFDAADVDHISFTRGSLTRQLCDANDDFATLRDCSETALSRKVFAVLLRGARLTIRRTLHHAGEVIEGRDDALARDQWFTDIIKVQFTEKALAKLDAALDITL